MIAEMKNMLKNLEDKIDEIFQKIVQKENNMKSEKKRFKSL